MNRSVKPDFSLVPTVLSGDPEALRRRAKAAWDAEDIEGLMILFNNVNKLRFLWDNSRALKHAGLYERVLLVAFTDGETRVGTNWEFRQLLKRADRRVLRACGDLLPRGKIKLYRGIGRAFKYGDVLRPSWTRSPNIAAWFATRAVSMMEDGGCPGVFSLTVRSSSIYCYTNARHEDECIVLLPEGSKAELIHPMPEPEPRDEIAEAYTAQFDSRKAS